MKLHITIPALNEEASIESIIRRCLEARSFIIGNSPVSSVEVTVVSDGSTDRTVELARQFEGQIRLIVFEQNKGYGAAIKEGWSQSDADLFGFLDADGTCDPRFFADLCRALESEQADVVLGGRLNRNSKMPLVRRIGNAIFATLLSAFAGKRVRDTASGMRVVRRNCLPKLYPLPGGLHFTPAMTARILMSGNLRLTEIDMPYHERDGESKLRIGKDGVRFLKSIIDMVLLYQPWRPLTAVGLASLAVAVALMAMPTLYYLQHRSVQEWMIYRFIVSHLAGTNAVLMLAAAYITGRMTAIALETRRGRDRIAEFLSWPYFAVVPLALMAFGGALVIPSLLELVRTGATYEHWSRFIAMSFSFSVALILLATWAVHYVLQLLGSQVDYLRSLLEDSPEARVEAALASGSASRSSRPPNVETTDRGTLRARSSETSHPNVAGKP